MSVQRKPDARAVKPMTPAELYRLMSRAGLSTAELAVRLGVTQRTVQGWAARDAIPYLAAYAIRHL